MNLAQQFETLSELARSGTVLPFWQDVFDTHRKALGKTTKPKTRNQIVKWLLNPYRDSAEYKMWGNGVALPCVWFVLSGIAYFFQDTETKSPE